VLLVHYAWIETMPVQDTGFDPADYLGPSMVTALLDDDWKVDATVDDHAVAAYVKLPAHGLTTKCRWSTSRSTNILAAPRVTTIAIDRLRCSEPTSILTLQPTFDSASAMQRGLT
jgi:hypothetical protein